MICDLDYQHAGSRPDTI